MARFPYDVNTTRRYIDVHKQFRGGLKTVDTDDALGAVFLREAENVSLSEFGFIEKRYGTFEKFRAGLNVSLNSKLQGYWEFLGKYIIIALDGRLYYQLLSAPTSDFTEVTQFYTKDTLTYPNGLAAYLGLESDFSVGSGYAGFQNDRPMGAVNLSDVLYMFTGKYPIYFVEEDDVLKAYLFAKETPNYAELVVTGHNLLENDYDDLYYNTNTKTMNIGVERAVSEETDIAIIDNDFFPEIPFAKDGTLTFNLNYDTKPEIVKSFVFDSTDETESILNTVTLKSLKYRPSGPGATDLSFDTIANTNYTANTLNNATDDVDESVSIVSTPLSWNNISNGIILNTNLTEGTEKTAYLKDRQWTHINYEVDESDNNSPDFRGNLKLEVMPIDDVATINYKEIELFVDDIPTTNTFESNKPMAFAIVDAEGTPIDYETRLQASQAQLNSYNLKDSRPGKFVATVFGESFLTANRLYFNIYWQNNETFIPIYTYSIPVTGGLVGQAKIEFETNGFIYSSEYDGYKINPNYRGKTADKIEVYLYDKNGDLFKSEFVKYEQPNNLGAVDLKVSEFFKAFPMSRDERAAFGAAVTSINKGTIIELIKHDSQQSADIVLETYRIGDNLTFEDGYYKFTLPDGLPPQHTQHYALRFKTTDVSVNAPGGFSYLFLSPSEESNYYGEATTQALQDAVLVGFGGQSLNDALFFRPVLRNQLPQITNDTYKSFNNQNWNIYPIVDNVSISAKDELGSSFLNVVINEGFLSGTFDFEFVYELKKEKIDYSTLALTQVQTPVEFSYIIKDITISPEKLQDYTFFQGDKAHPIWSCNQVIDHFNKLMVWGSKEMPTALFYSFPDRPFYFPSKFYLQFTNEENLPINSVVPYSKILVVQTESQTWGVKGNSGLVDAPSPYIEFSINSTVGTIAPKSVRPVRNKLFFLSKQGVIALNSLYAVDESYNIDFVDRNIRNIVPQDSDAVGIQFDNQYWLNFPKDSITLRWYIDKNAWVKDVYQGWDIFNGVFKYQIRDGKLEFITYPSETKHLSTEFIHKIGIDYTLPTDLTEAVVSKFETSFLNQNYPFHPKNYKEAKLDFTLQNEYNESKDAVYSMDDNEDMPSEFLHIVEDAPVEENHSYKLQYSFDPEYNIVDPGTFVQNYSDIYDGGSFSTNSYTVMGGLIFRGAVGTYDGGSFNNNSYNTTDGGTFSTNLFNVLGSIKFVDDDYLGAVDSTFDHLVIESVSVKEYNTDTVQPVYNLVVGEDFITFQIPNEIKGNKIDIQVVGNFTNYVGGADLYDITYDDTLVFKTWIISDDQTLNLDNINSYDQAKADVGIDFNDRLGTWVFGTSDFGKKVTAVKTIKLSGKGYNAKIYMEDYSKSKWTLESLGLTYKMKRARSR